MNESFIALKIIELAKVGGALAPEEAITRLAHLINALDRSSESYAQDMECLMQIGATIWDLQSGPGGAHDPTYVPPRIRP